MVVDRGVGFLELVHSLCWCVRLIFFCFMKFALGLRLRSLWFRVVVVLVMLACFAIEVVMLFVACGCELFG